MTVTQDVGNAPIASLPGPDHHELGNAFAASRRRFAEAMLPFLDRAIILDRIDAKTRGDQLPPHLATDILPRVFHDDVAVESRASGVVKEGNLRAEIPRERRQI